MNELPFLKVSRQLLSQTTLRDRTTPGEENIPSFSAGRENPGTAHESSVP